MQSNNRAEVRAVLHASEHKLDTERMVMVLDSEYVYDAVTLHMLRWERWK